MTLWHLHPEIQWPNTLSDESRLRGEAVAIAFPETEEEAADALREAWERGWSITVQGGRTGIAGGAVPQGGAILNLSRMTRILGLRRRDSDGAFVVRVQPGVTLSALRQALATRDFATDGWSGADRQALEEFRREPPWMVTADPTETSATVGGMVACNASGARSFRYGAIRRWVESVRVALADGAVLALARGRERARGRTFRLEVGGKILEGVLPSYRMPAVKNAAGYYAADDMDLLDLFIGSEGTLGVILEAELVLKPASPVEWGVTAFLPDTTAVVRFVREVRAEPDGIIAIEYFSGSALDLLRVARTEGGSFVTLPPVPKAHGGAVYVEIAAATEEQAEPILQRVVEVMKSCGGEEERAWLATEPREMERAKTFRHAVPERINALIAERKKREPAIIKLGTDMAVPDEQLDEVLALYERGLKEGGFEAVLFGHIGNNHVHVNILPRDRAEVEAARRLYRTWAEQVGAWGGTISAEHGVGKLKKSFLPLMLGEEGVRQMRAVKAVFDPGNRLGPGTLF